MRQVNGPGAVVALIAVLLAACAAECIPLALCLLAAAAGGIGYDYARGNVSDRDEPPGKHHLAGNGSSVAAGGHEPAGMLGAGAAAVAAVDGKDNH